MQKFLCGCVFPLSYAQIGVGIPLYGTIVEGRPGAEVPLWAWVRTPVSAEVGATPTYSPLNFCTDAKVLVHYTVLPGSGQDFSPHNSNPKWVVAALEVPAQPLEADLWRKADAHSSED